MVRIPVPFLILWLGFGPILAAAEPVRLSSLLSALDYAMAPGELKTFRVSASRGAVRWELSGPGQFVQESPGEAEVLYRAGQAGGSLSVLTACSELDPAQKVSYTLKVGPNPAAPVPTQVDLLGWLSYVPAERNQGSCSNCYAWAATAAIEMELAVAYGIRDRLSIQYFQSIYQPRMPEDSPDPCCANSFSSVLEHYQRHGRMVPWSNPWAAYQDGTSRCGVPRNSHRAVGLFPHYRVRSLTSTQIETQLWSQEECIQELKEVLCRGKAIIFKSGGHYLLIVGYDAGNPDPGRHHWVVLDSSGTLKDTPQMTRPLLMRSLDYSALSGPHESTYQFDFVDLVLDLPPAVPPVTTVAPAKAELRAGQPLELVANVRARPPVTYQWLKDGQDLPGQTGSVLQLAAAVQADSGSYGVRVANGAGSATSAPAQVTVTDSGNRLLTVDPALATLGAGGSREFRATVTGFGDSRVTWTLQGAGRLREGPGNTVTFTAAGPGLVALQARAVADPALAVTLPLTVKTQDLDGDGHADVLDLAVLAKSFRSVAGDPHYLEAADLNGDGVVDEQDALAFLAHLDGLP